MKRAILYLAAAALLSGCVPYTGIATETLQEENARLAPSGLYGRTVHAVDKMLAEAPVLLQAHSPAVVGSIADIRDMNRASPLGNVIAQMVRSRLVQRGLPVTDMRLRAAVRLEPRAGEMTLSRNRSLVYPPPQAAEIMTGTYAVASSRVYVSLQIIEADNARILAAGGFTLPRNDNVDRLLAGGFTGTEPYAVR